MSGPDVTDRLRSWEVDARGNHQIGTRTRALVLEAADEIERLRKVLDEIYPHLAARAMQLEQAGEEKAAERWMVACRLVAWVAPAHPPGPLDHDQMRRRRMAEAPEGWND